jgi:hypothetical protein
MIPRIATLMQKNDKLAINIPGTKELWPRNSNT